MDQKRKTSFFVVFVVRSFHAHRHFISLSYTMPPKKKTKKATATTRSTEEDDDGGGGAGDVAAAAAVKKKKRARRLSPLWPSNHSTLN